MQTQKSHLQYNFTNLALLIWSPLMSAISSLLFSISIINGEIVFAGPACRNSFGLQFPALFVLHARKFNALSIKPLYV